MKDLEHLKYPIGKFAPPRQIDDLTIRRWIEEIERLPEQLKEVLSNLSSEQLLSPYRPQGWSIRQLVHHLADSHMNALVRVKLALTEERPTIKPYMESLWAELADVHEADIQDSIRILEGLHARWAILLKNLNEKDFQRTFIHPEYGQEFSLAEAIGSYAWHGQHHLAHIRMALNR